MTNDRMVCMEIRKDAEYELGEAKRRLKQAIEGGCGDAAQLAELNATVSVWDRVIRQIDARCEQNWIAKHK